jgi:excisionase family DNA binding protein
MLAGSHGTIWLSVSINSHQKNPALLTIRDVSTTLRVSDKTVRRMIDRRELVAFRVGGQLRVSSDSVLALLRAGRVGS